MPQEQSPRQGCQAIRSASKYYRHTSAPIDPADISYLEIHTDSVSQKRIVFWEDILMIYKGALHVRHHSKVVPFLKGTDFQTLEPRRITADPDVVFDVAINSRPVEIDAVSTGGISQETPPTYLESRVDINGTTANMDTRRNPSYGLVEIAMDSYRNNDNPAFRPAPRAPQLHTSERTTPSNTTTRPRAPQLFIDTITTTITTTTSTEKFIQAMVNARFGDRDAQVVVGDMYRNGQRVPKDLVAAMDWYLKAADQGDANAQYHIGYLYDCGCGVDQDYAKAMEWYLKAASQGFAHAQYNIGCLYEYGQGVAQDYSMAMAWFLKAAVKDNIEAQSGIGDLYIHGKGVIPDFTQAMDWYLKAANQGNASSQYNIGWLYQHGKGVTQDYSQAMDWYLKAADQSFAPAQNNIGILYKWGQGVHQDDREAMKWYRKAANRGCDSAQFNIGWSYENGRGVSRSITEAMKYYTLAASQGHLEAIEALSRMKCMRRNKWGD